MKILWGSNVLESHYYLMTLYVNINLQNSLS